MYAFWALVIAGATQILFCSAYWKLINVAILELHKYLVLSI